MGAPADLVECKEKKLVCMIINEQHCLSRKEAAMEETPANESERS